MSRRVALVFGIAVVAAGLAAGRVAALGASITLAPTSGPPGTSISVKGTGFFPREGVVLKFDAQQVGTAFTDSLGRFTATIKAPTTAAAGSHTVSARGQRSARTAQAPFTVTTTGGGGVDWPQFRFDQSRTGFQP